MDSNGILLSGQNPKRALQPFAPKSSKRINAINLCCIVAENEGGAVAQVKTRCIFSQVFPMKSHHFHAPKRPPLSDAMAGGMPGGLPPDLNFFATGDLSVQLKDLEKSLGAKPSPLHFVVKLKSRSRFQLMSVDVS